MSDPDLWPCHSGVIGFSTVIAHITTADFVSNDLFSLPRPLAGGHSSSGRSAPQPSCSCGCLWLCPCLCSLRAPGQRGAPSLGLLGLLGLLPPAPQALVTPGHAGFVSVRWEPPSPHRAEPSLPAGRRAPAPLPAAAASCSAAKGRRFLGGAAGRSRAEPGCFGAGTMGWQGGDSQPCLSTPPRPEAGRSSGRGGLAGGGCGRRWPGLRGVRGALFRAMVPLFARCGDIWASLLPCRGPGPLPHCCSVILQKTTQLF